MDGERKILHSFDIVLDEQLGTPGTPERESFDQEAYNYCIGSMIHDVRKREKMTQQQLAEKVGSTKSYISRIEKGLIEPGAGFFLRILNALGCRFELVAQDSSCLSETRSATSISNITDNE